MPTYREKDILSKDQYFIDRVGIAARVVAVEQLQTDLSGVSVDAKNKLLATARAIIKETNSGANILALTRLAAATGTEDDDETPSDWGDNLIVTLNWVSGKAYVSGDFFLQSNQVYKVNSNHTSSSVFADDSANYDLSTNDGVKGIAGLQIEAVVRKLFPIVAGISQAD